MAVTRKIFGQANPSAATPTDLYTVPASFSFHGISLNVCNQSAVATTFRVSVSVAGAATTAKDYIAYDTPLPGNGIVSLALPITLATTDIVRVYAGSATVSFNLFGEAVPA
jgi:hypothetical protein